MNQETLGARLEAWLGAVDMGKKLSTQKYHAEIAGIIRKNMGPLLERMAQNITVGELGEFAQKVAHYSASRWNSIAGAIRHMTGNKDAMRYRKLKFRDFNPPTQEQFQNLLIECDLAPKSHVGLVVRLLALTGMRINEARQLRWEHVSEDSIRLPGHVTKNGSPRTIPHLPGTREVLYRLRQVSPGELVMPTPSVRTALRNACRRAGVRMSYHSFRHYFATRAIQSGAELCLVSKWLGHSDGGALASKIYYHVATDHSQRMAARVRIAV